MRITVRYVHPHPKTGRLQYRRRVPKHLRSLLGGEIIRRLDTQDPVEAAKRAEAVNREVEREFARLTASTTESDTEAFERTLRWMELRGFTPGNPATASEAAGRDAEADAILASYARDLRREPDPDDLSRDDLLKVQALKGSLEAPPMGMKDALRVYIHERGQGRRNDAEQRRFVMERERCVRMLIEVVGDKPVEAINRADARAYRDALIGKLNSVATVNKYLRNLRAIFGHIITEHDLKRANPFEKMQVEDPVAARDKRDSFTDDQLVTLVRTAKAEGLRADLRNILLILTDTGARLWEIAGLAKADVVLDADVPHILIRPNSIRHLKTKSSKRRVPLVGLALEAATEAVREAPEGDALFPAYTSDRGNTNASGALNKFLANKAKVKRPGLTVHSLRHTFKDRMRNAGIPADVRDRLQGHTSGTTGEDYGTGNELTNLRDQLLKVRPIRL